MKVLLVPILLLTFWAANAQTKSYELVITDTLVNYTGSARKAIAINGSIPGPVLEFTEGDSAVITVTNKLHHETSIHWHGLLLPNEQDGVPYLTTVAIMPHAKHVYRFVIRQTGTYWYHSHSMLQEQVGMYGAIVIHPKSGPAMKEEVLLLSDWSDERPEQIERSLHYATDWYMIRKNAVQSYGEALVSGKFWTKALNEWKRMHAMDVSDVYYDQFIVNGKKEDASRRYVPGEKVRLRVINGSSSTYFWLAWAGGTMDVVATDGAEVEPVAVDRLIVGVSETYDVIITVPDSGSYEFLATSEDRVGITSFWIGEGTAHFAQRLGRLNYFEGMDMMNDMMTTGGKMDDMGMNMSLQKMDMNSVMYPEAKSRQPKTLNYGMLRSQVKTVLPSAPVKTFHFELTGNMNRYVWTIDNKTISESDMILISPGDNIRIVLTNNSMMRHPMHLHGHFFRLLNEHGDYSPLKTVVDIMPMETDTIEFHASEEYGYWYFHCHILYHMMAGMGRIFRYENSPVNQQIGNSTKALRKVYRDDRRFYPGAEISLESTGSDGEVSLMNTRWKLQAEWRVGINDNAGQETESHFGKFLGRNQFMYVYGGWDWRSREVHNDSENLFGIRSTKDKRSVACFGFQYKLPWLVTADVRIDHTGYLRIQVERDDIPVTKRIRLWGMYNSDREYAAGVRYVMTKYVSVSSHYDSDMGLGAGVTIVY